MGQQSAFTNTSVFDRNYLEALFGGSEFPDGTFMIDDIEEIVKFQKTFMEVMSDIRSENMFTFPVSSISLIRKDGKFLDEEFSEWAIKHNMKWSDSNFFIDDNVSSLSNCPLSPDTKILYWSNRYNQYKLSSINDVYNNCSRDNTIPIVKVLSNGQEINCKINQFDISPEYEITLVNGAKIKTTANHLNKVYGKDYISTSELTVDDYLPYGIHAYENSDFLTYEVGKIVGAFLGAGSYTDRGIVLSLNVDTDRDLIDWLEDYIPRNFGGTCKEYFCLSQLSGQKKCVNFKIKSLCLKDLIKQCVNGDSALNKSINLKVLNYSKKFRKGIIDGWYQTDGGNNNRIYTSSIDLVESMNVVFMSLGLVTRVDEDNREGRLGDNTCYTVRYYNPNIRKKLKNIYIIDDDYMWIKIKSIKRCKTHVSTSYCLEVLDDVEPIFTLGNGIITHNCRLKSDIQDLLYFNSIGGSALRVGSVKVSTINLARLALDTETTEEFIEELKRRTLCNVKVLHIIRKIIQRNVEKGLLPNFSYDLVNFDSLYNTIGFIGVSEAMTKFGFIYKDEFGNHFYSKEAEVLGKKIFDTMDEVANKFLKDNGYDYKINKEQAPAENAAAKLMRKDEIFYPEMDICELSLYGNQFVPLGMKATLQERIRVQALFDGFCNGG